MSCAASTGASACSDRLTVKSIRVFEGDEHDILHFEEGGFESVAAVRVVERAG